MSRLAKSTLRAMMQLLWLIDKTTARLTKKPIHSLSRSEQDQIFPYLELVSATANDQTWHMEAYKRLFRQMEQQGIHLTPNHFYSPIPDTDRLRSLGERAAQTRMMGIDWQVERQLDLLANAFPPFAEETTVLPQQASPELPGHAFYFHNGMYDFLDALVLYCMVRHFKPRMVLEVGSGFSTRITAQAALKNGNTQVTAIEPYPDEVLQAGFPGLSTLIVKKAEEVELSLFEQLQANDILFIDTSHVVKTGGDVNYLYLEVLPRLQAGVIVHVHDIFLPEDYPLWWITERTLFWNEQYLLQAFLTQNTDFQTLFANNYMRLNHLEQVKKIFPACPNYDYAQSFWVQRVHSSDARA
jgi:hypothetical protein